MSEIPLYLDSEKKAAAGPSLKFCPMECLQRHHKAGSSWSSWPASRQAGWSRGNHYLRPVHTPARGGNSCPSGDQICQLVRPSLGGVLTTTGTDPKVSSGRKFGWRRLEKGHLLLPVRCQLAGLLVVAAQAVHARFNQDKAELRVAVLAVALQMLTHRHLRLQYRVS